MDAYRGAVILLFGTRATESLLVMVSFICNFCGQHAKQEVYKRVNRFTIWIWLYVSVTGVLIYYLLYHLFPAINDRAVATATTMAA